MTNVLPCMSYLREDGLFKLLLLISSEDFSSGSPEFQPLTLQTSPDMS